MEPEIGDLGNSFPTSGRKLILWGWKLAQAHFSVSGEKGVQQNGGSISRPIVVAGNWNFLKPAGKLFPATLRVTNSLAEPAKEHK